MKSRSAFVGLLAAAFGFGCGESDMGVANVLLVSSVEVAPASGNLVLGGNAQLSATPRTASGVAIPGRTVVWASSNEAIVTVSQAGVITAVSLGGPVRVTGTVDGVSGESLVTVQPFPVSRVAVTPDQAGLMVGGSSELTATAYDAQGSPLPGRLVIWQSSAPAVVAVTSTGIIIGMSEGGPVRITATVEGKADTALVSVAPRPATQLSFLQQPASATAGNAMTPAIRVAIQNDQGGTVSAATNQVTIALSTNAPGATLSGTTTVAAVNGVATFSNLSLDRAGSGYTFTVTSTGLASATSVPFANVAGAATRLAFTTTPPSSVASGVALAPQPVIQIQDAFGNAIAQAGVVITASVGSGTATLSGTTSATTNASGTATFLTLALNGPAGNVTLAFNGGGLTPATSAPIALSAGSATALAMVTQPSSSAQSGVALAVQPVVKLRDAAGNDVPNGGVVVTATIASGPAGGTLGGGATATTNGNGVATFSNLAISGSPGSYTLQFTSPSVTPVTSSPIVVAAAGANALAITVQPSSSASSGIPLAQQPILQLRDGSGNAINQSGVAITAAIASGAGTLGGTLTVTTNASGVASFTDLVITGLPGNRTLSFSGAGLTPVTSGIIDVVLIPATASKLTITTEPASTATSGVALNPQPVIQLSDAANNPVSLGGVVVTAAIASGGGTLGGTTSRTTNSAGVATFTGLVITGTAGIRTLSFSSGSLTPATSIPIDVTIPAATKLGITTQPPTSAASGTTFTTSPVIQLQNASGAAVSQSGVPVTVSVATGGATLSGTLTVNTASNGRATFTGLRLTGPVGSHTLRFTSPGLTDVVSGTIALGAGTAVKLVITTEPSATATSTKAFSVQPKIQLLDASDNPVPRSGVTVTATLNSGSGTLGGDRTENTNGSGRADFKDLRITGTGVHTIRFTASGMTEVISISITVVP